MVQAFLHLLLPGARLPASLGQAIASITTTAVALPSLILFIGWTCRRRAGAAELNRHLPPLDSKYTQKRINLYRRSANAIGQISQAYGITAPPSEDLGNILARASAVRVYSHKRLLKWAILAPPVAMTLSIIIASLFTDRSFSDALLNGDRRGWMYAANLISGLLCQAAAIYSVIAMHRRYVQASAHATAIQCLALALLSAFHVKTENGSILRLDVVVSTACSELSTFANFGYPGASAVTRAKISSHIAQVNSSLQAASSRLMINGTEAADELIALTAKALARAFGERWQGLLDESDLDVTSVTSDQPAIERRRDIILVLSGLAIASILTVTTITLGLPTGGVIGSMMAAFAIAPAAIWGSSRLGLNPSSLLPSASAPADVAAASPGRDSEG